MALQPSPLALAPAAVDESRLVTEARGGDARAREELARHCRQPAYLLALQLLGNPDDALDVCQDALLRFFTTLDRFDERRPVKPWLLRIVRNRARDLMRRRRVRRHQSLDASEDGYTVEAVDPAADPEADAQRRQLQRRVWRALARVPGHHREILVLRDYQDLSYAEIAQVLGIPLGTVMSRLHAARKNLRAHLEQELGSLIQRGGGHA